MILRLCPQVFEDRLLPITFHVIPVIDLTMPDRIADTVTGSFGIRNSFIANEEVEVFYTAL
jgi:hypothetical protein